MGVTMLASGGQTQDIEDGVRQTMRSLGLPDPEVVITYATISLSYVAPGDAEATTAIRVVRSWTPDFDRLAAASALVRAITDGRVDLGGAEAELDRIECTRHPYPRWLLFLAPPLLSFAVTVMFGGTLVDAFTTLGIGLAIQPAMERIERSSLPSFFQVAFGVLATVLLVLLLVRAGLPIQGDLVLTGSLLRFLPGAALVSGVRDLIGQAYTSGVARIAEVVLVGVAIAGAATLVLSIGTDIGVHLEINDEGYAGWPAAVIVCAGMAAVASYACRLGVPGRALAWAAGLGAATVLLARGFTPATAGMDQITRTLVAALVIGAAGRLLAQRTGRPAALWSVPCILPLLPAPATLLPLLAVTEAAREALQGRAAAVALAIGVGVACGDILVASYFRHRQQVAEAVSEGVRAYVVRPLRGRARRRGRPRPR
jgi:uncharacterized membrane protein YjjP (DUF1212 family)